MIITLETIKELAQRREVYTDTPCFEHRGIRILTQDVRFLTSTGQEVHIRKGFEWDEASVPYGLRAIFPKSGKYAFSALLHDALYYMTQGTQEQADYEFYLWMLATINPQQAWFRYKAVQLFGWTYWNKNLKKPSTRCRLNRRLITIL